MRITASVTFAIVGIAAGGVRAQVPNVVQPSQAVRQLQELATGRATPPTPELVSIIATGLGSRETRDAALLAIAGRGALPRIGKARGGPEGAAQVAQWRAEKAGLATIAPLVEEQLADESAYTRHMAVLAVATLGLDADRLPAVVVGDRALSVLRGRYAAEGSGAVRAEIVKTAALCNDVGAARETIILEALGDSDAGVLAFALTGVGAMRLERAVEKVAPSLGHEDKRVRIAAATALGRLGRAALPKMASLDQALALETDEVVKQTLQATVNSLRRLPQ